MTHVLERPREFYLPLYFEVEEIDTPETFAAELIGALLQQSKFRSMVTSLKRLPRKVADVATERIDEVGVEVFKLKLKDALGEDWASMTRRLILEMEKTAERVVFILDEFPQMVDNIARKHNPETASRRTPSKPSIETRSSARPANSISTSIAAV